MREITINIFKFNELSDDAKERARDKWRETSDLSWGDESKDSIRAFCQEFGAKLVDWSIGPYAPLDYKVEGANFRGRKLKEFTGKEMPTGYCLDCDLWETFCKEFKRTGSAKVAFELAIYNGFKAWRDDMESQQKDDYIDDMLIANEYEFKENGDFL